MNYLMATKWQDQNFILLLFCLRERLSRWPQLAKNYVSQVGVQFTIFQSQPPKPCDCSSAPPHPKSEVKYKKTQARIWAMLTHYTLLTTKTNGMFTVAKLMTKGGCTLFPHSSILSPFPEEQGKG